MKRYLLVTGFCLSLLLPFVEAGVFLDRAWRWGEALMQPDPRRDLIDVGECELTYYPSGSVASITCGSQQALEKAMDGFFGGWPNASDCPPDKQGVRVCDGARP